MRGRISIRIKVKSRIRTRIKAKRGSPDPHHNVSDPQHWHLVLVLKQSLLLKSILAERVIILADPTLLPCCYLCELNVQDPISNFGVVLGAVSKRAMGGLGLGSGNTLADQVGHPRNPASDPASLPPVFIISDPIPQPDRSFLKEKRKTVTFFMKKYVIRLCLLNAVP
jgi:hypothetical protein